MPIIERTARRCFDVFLDHLRAVVAATVTDRYQIGEILGSKTKTRTIVCFREKEPIEVPIDTRFGRLYFYLGQALEAEEHPEGYQLRTRQYWYRLQPTEGWGEQAAIRWEYDWDTHRARHPRHHTQLHGELDLGPGAKLDLDKAHLPTGWVTFEEVIRFLIVDLEMKPPCGDKWPDLLEESERVFFEEFTGKRHKPAAG